MRDEEGSTDGSHTGQWRLDPPCRRIHRFMFRRGVGRFPLAGRSDEGWRQPNSVELDREPIVWEQEVGGSNPPSPTTSATVASRTCGCSSTARAPAFQAGGAGSIPVTRSTSSDARPSVALAPSVPAINLPHRHPVIVVATAVTVTAMLLVRRRRAGGVLLHRRRPRVGRVRRAGHRLRDPPRPGGRPRLHQLRRVPCRRRGGGAGRGPAARDGPAPARPGGSRAVGPARLLRPSRRPPGVAADGGRRAGRVR